MEGVQWRGLLAPPTLLGTVAAGAGGGRKPPARDPDNVPGGHAAEAVTSVPARLEEYRKIFGAASASSIPVLDLPPPSDGGCGLPGFSALDYLDIFGGFDGHDFAVPYEELFFAATQESIGVGAARRPPSASDNAIPPSAKTCTTRGLTSSGVAYHLGDGTNRTNMSYDTARWSSKDGPVHGTIHKNQVHATSVSTFVVENTRTNKPTQVVTDTCFYSNGSEETSEGQHLKKSVVSTSSCSNTKNPRNDMKAEPRPSKLEFSASRSAVNEQHESFTSSNWSTVSGSNVVSVKFSNSHSLHEDFVEKQTEGKWQNNTTQSTVMSTRSGNDLKVQCVASEDIPANEVLFSCSSSDHAASHSSESIPNYLTDHINFDAVDVKIAEADHFMKSTLQSPSSSWSSDYDHKAEEKQFNSMSKFLENSCVIDSHQSHISNRHSMSSWYQSYPDAAFLTVSDIILRTQPSQRPPPDRSPPARPPPYLDVCRPSANCHSYGIATGAIFRSQSLKQAVVDISPLSFDAGLDECSTAVASVAAIKGALGHDGKSNGFAMEKMMREFRISRQAANSKDNKRNCGSVERSLQEVGLEEVSEKALGHEETENKMTLTEKYMEGREGANNQKVWGKPFDLDEDEKELELTHASCVYAESTHLMVTSKNQEDEYFNCIMTDESACFQEGNEMEPEEARLLFEQYKIKKTNITQQTFKQAENEKELEAAHEVHDHKGNSEKLNEIKESDGCNGNEKELKHIQKLLTSAKKERQQKDAGSNIAHVAGILDGVEDSIVAARGDYKKKINESIKEVQVVLDPREAILLGKHWRTCKAGQVSMGKRGTEWPDENVSEVHETKEEAKDTRIKLKEQKEGRIELEEEKEGGWARKEEEKDRRRRIPEEEKEMERTLEEGKEGETMFQDVKDVKRKYKGKEKGKRYEVEERGRKKTEDEREKGDLDEEHERKKLEEDEMERRKLEMKERDKRRLEEEGRERNKLEEKEGEWRMSEEKRERRKLQEKERERRRLEEEDGDTKLEGEKDKNTRVEEEGGKKSLENSERNRRNIEEKEREGREMEQEREMEEEKELERIKSEEEKDKEWGRVKDRQTVEGEAHEGAFVEDEERAESVAVEMVTAESQQRVVIEDQKKAEKTSAETLQKSLADKASGVARLRAKHAAVERAMAEAQAHAIGMAVAEKTTCDARECAEKFAPTSSDMVKRNGNLSDMWDPDLQFQDLDSSSSGYQRFSESSHASGEKFGGSEVESSIRCKARMERHQRTVKRMAKALTEKNMRDIIAQMEQAERNRLAETLDADVRRWSNGKEGNLRALLSTLQYILGPDSGWQAIPLTDVITAPAVNKAYRKAMLCVHPDKLQQRSASIQQKYICEKVFDLLKEGWNKFNSEEW